MGFFDALKNAANFITGGGATVNVSTGQQWNDGSAPFTIHVQVAVKDASISMRNCYVKVRAVETVKAEANNLYQEVNGEFQLVNREISESVTTYETQLMAAGAAQLEANQVYEFAVEFEVPDQIAGTYIGHNAKHEWSIMAGIDTTGNDPDSGWVYIDIAK